MSLSMTPRMALEPDLTPYVMPVIGSFSAPVQITAVGGITAPTTSARMYVEGAGGPVDITANPQISPGTANGQLLYLVGCSDVNTLLLEDGNGLGLNGAALLMAGYVIELYWDSDSNLWREDFRNF